MKLCSLNIPAISHPNLKFNGVSYEILEIRRIGFYVCKNVAERRRLVYADFFDLVATMKGAISLGVGEPDYVTPWHIRETAIYSIEKGYTMYTSNAGNLIYANPYQTISRDAYKVNYTPTDEILITTGVSEALDLAMRAILDPG